MYGPPVDMSFKDLCHVTGVLSEIPREGQRPLNRNVQGMYMSRVLRLSNNNLADLDGLEYTLGLLLARPSKIGWLDLSFNKLKSIDSVLCNLQELHVLYLHGNRIWNQSAIDKLGALQHLHTITLHGNPIEHTQNYRSYAISALPKLKKMDFSSVTRNERALAKIRRYCPTYAHDF
ncbi:leucine-rich repeat-containing protein 51-like [Brachyistius frenatus]|uniref:leucine-rich repeat-containing protein 51-like n=1 Tax=Brachyistius frenatus TaxID=100188 RepID=UPI0037E86163